jgi:hypothetical protein
MTAFTFSATATVPKLVWVTGNCCGAKMEYIEADGGNEPGVVPCTFGDGVVGLGAAVMQNWSCTHPGTGKNAVVWQEFGDYGNHFKDIYVEITNGSDLTTPAVSITGAMNGLPSNDITGLTIGDEASSTRYMVQIASGAYVKLRNAIQSVSTNAINDLNTGVPVTWPARVNIPAYPFEPQTYTVNAAAQAANINAATLLPAALVLPGNYRIGCFMVVTQAATTSSTLGTCSVSFNERETNTGVGTTVQASTSTMNIVGGTHLSGVAQISVRGNVIITYSTQSYASSGATPMQYAIRLTIEYLGP